MDQTIINQLEGLISDLKNTQRKETIVDMKILREIFLKGYKLGKEDVFKELFNSSLYIEVNESINFNHEGFDVDLSFEKEVNITEDFINGIRSDVQYNSSPEVLMDAEIKEIIETHNVVLIEDSSENVQEESERKHQVTKEEIDEICDKMRAKFDRGDININSTSLDRLDTMVETLVHIFGEIMAEVRNNSVELAMDCLISVDEEYFDGKFTYGISKKYDYNS